MPCRKVPVCPISGMVAKQELPYCRVLKTKAASPVYHLDGGVYGWYRAFGDEGFTGRAIMTLSRTACLL